MRRRFAALAPAAGEVAVVGSTTFFELGAHHTICPALDVDSRAKRREVGLRSRVLVVPHTPWHKSRVRVDLRLRGL